MISTIKSREKPKFIRLLLFPLVITIGFWVFSSCGSRDDHYLITRAEQEKETYRQEAQSAQKQAEVAKNEAITSQKQLEVTQKELQTIKQEVSSTQEESERAKQTMSTTKQESAFLKGLGLAGIVISLVIGTALGSRARKDSQIPKKEVKPNGKSAKSRPDE